MSGYKARRARTKGNKQKKSVSINETNAKDLRKIITVRDSKRTSAEERE
jgi:hypothetical protein